MASRPLRLFEGYGVELEYMIVDARHARRAPDRRPRCSRPARRARRRRRRAARSRWSNELGAPRDRAQDQRPGARARRAGRAASQASVRRIERAARAARRAACCRARCIRGWIPQREIELWPHDDREIYARFDRIFDCRGHGWANLQSVHLNLPFARRRRVRPAARRDPRAAAAPARAGRELAVRRRRATGPARHPARRLPRATPGASRR